MAKLDEVLVCEVKGTVLMSCLNACDIGTVPLTFRFFVY